MAQAQQAVLRSITVHVLADDSNGAPALVKHRVSVTDEGYNTGAHYDEAIRLAEGDGYSECKAFDENDPAGRLLALLAAGALVAADAARTPKEGEPCSDAAHGVQRWYDQEHVEGRLFRLVDEARTALGVKNGDEAERLLAELSGER